MRNSRPPGKEKQMIDSESWRISIENAADYIAAQIGSKTVEHIFRKYHATCADDLSPLYYSEVYNELSSIQADLT